MNLTRWAAPAALLLAVSFATQARADDLKSTARSIAQKTQKAIVTARLVVKISTGENEVEQKIEIAGTMIDASGLTVVSATQVDPTAAVQRMGGGRRGGRGGGGGGGGGEQMRIDTEITETTLVLDDGTELESDVVLKDADLDLAFIRPRDAKGAKLDYVDLKAKDGAAAQVLDDVFVVGRLGRVANRAGQRDGAVFHVHVDVTRRKTRALLEACRDPRLDCPVVDAHHARRGGLPRR